MARARPMSCPECTADICLKDLHLRCCPGCKTEIRVSRTFQWKVQVAALPISLAIMYVWFHLILKASFLSFLLLTLLMLALVVGVGLVTNIVAYLLIPPRIERADYPIRLNLR
jgi:hypothetical protein